MSTSTSRPRRQSTSAKTLPQGTRSHLHLLYHPKADHRNLLVILKSSSPDTFPHVTRLALQIPIPRTVLLGHPFPQSVSPLYDHVPLPSTGSLRRELLWATEILLQFPKHLNEFLQASALIEKHLFVGDFN